MKYSVGAYWIVLLGLVSAQVHGQAVVEPHAASLELFRSSDGGAFSHWSVRNNSQYTVLRFCMTPLKAHSNSAWNGPLKPGETMRFSSQLDLGDAMITSAIFSNGSYQGDAEIAGQMAESYMGVLVEFKRIEKTVDSILAAPPGDRERTLDAIHLRLTDMTDKADIITWKELRKNFPSLRFDDRLAGLLERGMAGAKTIWILQFESLRRNSVDKPLNVWWEERRSLVRQNFFPLGYEPDPLHKNGSQ